jgi:uncharacterized protein YbjT (DUF2867 family)
LREHIKIIEMKKVIVTGATGMVGRGVLLECLDHQDITEVLSIGRSPLGIHHPKLKELIHQDFSEFESVKSQLEGFDGCFMCMGVSSAGMKEELYHKMTYDYTLALANILAQSSKDLTITYVSGVGTDSTEKGRTMWARVKGKTENHLLRLGFKRAFMFRPGAIIPLRGIKSRTKIYQFIYDYFMWLIKGMKLVAPNRVVNTTQIGLAMINGMLNGYIKDVLEPPDIIQLSKHGN